MTATDLLQRLDRAAEAVALEPAHVARALAIDGATVEAWYDRDARPASADHQRLSELVVVLERLSAILKPRAAHDWLFRPNALLDGRLPIDLLSEGQVRRVRGAIEAFAEGVFV